MPEFLLMEIPLKTRDGTKNPTPAVGEIVAPGLVITPEIGYDVRLTGRWVLTHVESGRATNGHDNGACLACIRDYAEFVIATGIDWTKPHSDLADIVRVQAGEGSEWQAKAMALRNCPGDCSSLARLFEF